MTSYNFLCAVTADKSRNHIVRCDENITCDFVNPDARLDSCSQLRKNENHNFNELYFREKEIEILRQASLEVTNTKRSRMIVIKGENGIGKTSLARCFVKSNKKQELLSSYFIECKFHLTNDCVSPNAIYSSALLEFFEKLNEDQRYEIRKGIKDNLSGISNPSKIISSILHVLPELKTILVSDDSSKTDLVSWNESLKSSHDKYAISANEIQRPAMAYANILRLMTNSNVPVILFLDDIQWATKPELDLFLAMVAEIDNPGILFICTYNILDGSSDTIRDRLQLNRIELSSAEICLNRLTEKEVQKIVFDHFCSHSVEFDNQQANFVWNQSKGNIFLVMECIRVMDLADETNENNNSSNTGPKLQPYTSLPTPTDVVGSSFDILDEHMKEKLKLLSCLGTKIDDKILSLLMDEDGRLDAPFLQKWLCFDETHKMWLFRHTYIQNYVYSLIPESDRSEYHYNIGRTLWKNIDFDQINSIIFVLVKSLLKGELLIVDPKERIAVAILCLSAGEHAVKIAGFHEGCEYFLRGIDLLDSEKSWKDNYQLCLQLYSSAVECCYSTGDFARTFDLINIVLDNAMCSDDTVRVRLTYLTAIGSSGQTKRATATGIEFLKHYNEDFPLKPSRWRVLFEAQRLRMCLARKSDEFILKLPRMENKEKLAAMQVMNLISLHSLMTNPLQGVLICCRMVNLTMTYGLCLESCIGFVVMGRMLCCMERVDEGFRLGQLAFSMYEMFQNKSFMARFFALYYTGAFGRKLYICRSAEPQEIAYRVGLDTGDIEFAMLCGTNAFISILELVPLPETERKMHRMTEHMKLLKQEAVVAMVNPLRQMIQNLMEPNSEKPWLLKGRVFDESDVEKLRASSDNLYKLGILPQLVLRYFFGEFSSDTLALCRKVHEIKPWDVPPHYLATLMLFHGLCYIAFARKNKQRRSLQAKKYSKILFKWSKNEPLYNLGRHLLLEAELDSLCARQQNDTLSKYMLAIDAAKQTEFTLMYALSNELAYKHLLRNGTENQNIEIYLRSALVTYTAYGAIAKVQHLTDECKLSEDRLQRSSTMTT